MAHKELSALGLISEIKATYDAAVRSGRELVSYALQIGRLLNQARPNIRHGEWEDYVENICGIPYGTACRWQSIAKGVDAGLEIKSLKLKDLKAATSIEDVKKLVAASKPQSPIITPPTTGEQEAVVHEEPAVSGTEVNTVDAGSTVYDDAELDKAIEPAEQQPVSWFEKFRQLWEAADDVGRIAIRAFFINEPVKRKGFIKPTLAEVTEYCQERGKGVDPGVWMDHYTSNGWKVGRNAMKDWMAAVRTWEKNALNASPATTKKGRSAMEFTE